MSASTAQSGSAPASGGAASRGSGTAGRSGSAAGGGWSGSAGERGRAADVCLFYLGLGCFGLDVRLVGEVVAVSKVTPVPGAPAGVLGLFNLRGTPVALLDLASVLGLAESAARPAGRETTALVLLTGSGILAAAQVDRVGAVLAAERARLSATDRASDHAAVVGLLETESHGVVTLLDGEVVVRAIQSLRAG